ncbi:hypothetical protein E2C01_090416 [Portunus trituberculatus]|uniref:Uncharacterized protein n=1 Tax=Portunus trituberculatus TaxID=210409 RepID=A0A5B7JKU5_PORTR|nr:hypothetical protein [Portunus trituberculatus]
MMEINAYVNTSVLMSIQHQQLHHQPLIQTKLLPPVPSGPKNTCCVPIAITMNSFHTSHKTIFILTSLIMA